MASPSFAGRLQIAHVLFVDVVSYSVMPMDKQEQTLRALQEAVRNTEEFVRARDSDQLISLPTGDGMALVFFNDAEAPAHCAVQLSRALQSQADIKVRMGIHSGPVYRVADITRSRGLRRCGCSCRSQTPGGWERQSGNAASGGRRRRAHRQQLEWMTCCWHGSWVRECGQITEVQGWETLPFWRSGRRAASQLLYSRVGCHGTTSEAREHLLVRHAEPRAT